jgi:hypothetical protein
MADIAKKGVSMKVNTEKVKSTMLGGILGAIIVMIVGFGWGGWVLGSTSQKKADAMVEDAIIARLTPMCVEKFNQDADKEEKFRELTEKSYWDREQYVKAQGWATMPFEKEPDSRVAEVCAKRIMNGQ